MTAFIKAVVLLEYRSLSRTIKYFKSSADAKVLSSLMFEHWVKPPLFEESRRFFECAPVPVYIVSNIDRDDILSAIKFHGLKPAVIFTSEDARAYKPRKELFEFALKNAGLFAEQVVHIGDSLSSDIKGASAMGINAVWINRNRKKIPEGVHAVDNLLQIYSTELLE